MTLSELAYHAVKNVKYFDDPAFTLGAFRAGDYDADQDYANSINNALAPINEAIHRLSDRNKLPRKIASLGVPESSMLDVSQISRIKKITNVFYMEGTEYERIGFREYGGFVLIDFMKKAPAFVEYMEDVPNFSKQWTDYMGSYYEAGDVDLAEYGINETMCGYIVEYVQGKLLEPIAPDLANMHITRAEQYFDDLEEPTTPFGQQVVARRFGIER